MSLLRITCWVLAILGLVATAGVVAVGIRQHDTKSELEHSIRHSAADQAWLAGLPQVPDELRERTHAWMRTSWPTPGGPDLAVLDWFVKGTPPPAKALARHEKVRAHVAELTKMLDGGVTCLSSSAWIADALKSEQPHSELHIANLLSVRGAAKWYVGQAMLDEDPLPQLANLDRLVAALRRSSTLIDAMIENAIVSMRDAAIARLAFRQRLPASYLAAWLAETPHIRKLTRDTMRGERLMWCRLGELLLSGNTKSEAALYGDDLDVEDRIDLEWNAHRDVSRLIESIRLYEGYLDGDVEPAELDQIARWELEGGRTTQLSMMNYDSLTGMVLSTRTQHRINRLVVHLMQLNGPRPETTDELRTRLGDAATLLDAGSWDVELAYHPVGTDRMRVYVPETAIVPVRVPQGFSQHRFNPREKRGAWLDASPLHLNQAYCWAELQVR